MLQHRYILREFWFAELMLTVDRLIFYGYIHKENMSELGNDLLPRIKCCEDPRFRLLGVANDSERHAQRAKIPPSEYILLALSKYGEEKKGERIDLATTTPSKSSETARLLNGQCQWRRPRISVG